MMLQRQQAHISISWQGGDSYIAAGSNIYRTSDGWATHLEIPAGVFQQISALRNGNFLIRNNNSAQIGNFTSGTGWIDMPQTFQAQNVGYVGANRLAGITSIDFASDSLLGDSHLYGGGSYPLIYLYNSDSNKMLPVPTMPTPEYHYPWVMPINGALAARRGFNRCNSLFDRRWSIQNNGRRSTLARASDPVR